MHDSCTLQTQWFIAVVDSESAKQGIKCCPSNISPVLYQAPVRQLLNSNKGDNLMGESFKHGKVIVSQTFTTENVRNNVGVDYSNVHKSRTPWVRVSPSHLSNSIMLNSSSVQSLGTSRRTSSVENLGTPCSRSKRSSLCWAALFGSGSGLVTDMSSPPRLAQGSRIDLTHTIRNASTSVQRRFLVNVRAVVIPSPVGDAIE